MVAEVNRLPQLVELLRGFYFREEFAFFYSIQEHVLAYVYLQAELIPYFQDLALLGDEDILDDRKQRTLAEMDEAVEYLESLFVGNLICKEAKEW